MPAGVKESERALVKFKGYSLRLAWPQEHFLKSFQFLNRPENWRIFFAYVELSNFRSGALAGIGHRKAHSYEATVILVVFLKPGFHEAAFHAVVLLSRLDTEIGVSERRVGQSEAERKLRYYATFFVATVADKYPLRILNRSGIRGLLVKRHRKSRDGRVVCNQLFPGERQFARGIDCAKKDFSKCLSAVLSWI